MTPLSLFPHPERWFRANESHQTRCTGWPNAGFLLGSCLVQAGFAGGVGVKSRQLSLVKGGCVSQLAFNLGGLRAACELSRCPLKHWASMESIRIVQDKMSAAIETKNLVKRYGNVTAVDGLSLRVDRGEIYAFLGLNGAGKTTTIRMLLGMVKPTSGEAHVFGTQIRVGDKKPWNTVGYLVEMPNAYPELSVRENLETMRRLRPGTESKAVERIIELLGLSIYADRRAGTLSRGNAQRLGLAKALLHNPELLILDEPANGLDPAGIVEIRELLLELVREKGVTVFMSSHILGEVSRLAHRIGIIHQGRLIQELDVDKLERNRRRRLAIRTRDCEAARAVLVGAGFSAELMPGNIIEVKDNAALKHPDDIATQLVKAGYAPMMLNIEQEDLEHYFLRLVGIDGATTP